jgi:FKBP-type peptidyl-prolyl cis-trans isomerase
MQAEAIAKGEEQLKDDIEIIEQYLAENNITAQSTESGLRYVIELEGSGDHPEPGDNVKVHYTGTLLDGTKFDSSLDRNEPLEFAIGRRQVIQGWDEGIALLKPGGKGTLFIPSPLAYGERGAGGVIAPNSVLKFDVELVEVN